jgi:hypothetical protein
MACAGHMYSQPRQSTMQLLRFFTMDLFFFKRKCVLMAEVYAFSAGGAFVVVYFWCPGDFVAGHALVCFFGHALLLLEVYCLCNFQFYLQYLNIVIKFVCHKAEKFESRIGLDHCLGQSHAMKYFAR